MGCEKAFCAAAQEVSESLPSASPGFLLSSSLEHGVRARERFTAV